MARRVIIVGAGVAGLACAHRLQAAETGVLLLEASDAVGGRVRTDTHHTGHGDFLLDRGFQIYLDAYPEGKQILDLEALELGAFAPAADVFVDGRFARIADPLRRPIDAARSLMAGVAAPTDAFALGRLIGWARRTGNDPDRTPDESAIDLLRRSRLSGKVIDRVFRPFFGGVFFDHQLNTSARMLAFTLKHFAAGRATLPARGMGAIPAQLAATLPQDSIRTNTRVFEATPTSVTTMHGEHLTADAVVLATNCALAAPELTGWRSTATLWYAFQGDIPSPDILKLDGQAEGPINHLAVVSAAQPGYAPEGWHLAAASTTSSEPAMDAELITAASLQLTKWFGRSATDWQLLRVDRIHHALPRQNAGELSPWRRPARRDDGVFVCGDSFADASINGAMASGRRAADAVLESLGG